jgi:hypothetical protein
MRCTNLGARRGGPEKSAKGALQNRGGMREEECQKRVRKEPCETGEECAKRRAGKERIRRPTKLGRNARRGVPE